MAYDEALAERARRVLDGTAGLEEKAMFGGIAWLVNGNMAGGVVKEKLCVRVGPDAYESALAERHAEPMTFTGMAGLRGFVYVMPAGLSRNEDLAKWLGRGVAFAKSLPKKTKKKVSEKKKRSR
jgi:TfoX/Sxy family transcriptional regulator of competence genes